MMKLLNLVNYDELINLLGTMNFMNYKLWTAMNSNCDMVNCCEGSKVLCLYFIMLLCYYVLLCVRGMNMWRQ